VICSDAGNVACCRPGCVVGAEVEVDRRFRIWHALSIFSYKPFRTACGTVTRNWVEVGRTVTDGTGKGSASFTRKAVIVSCTITGLAAHMAHDTAVRASIPVLALTETCVTFTAAKALVVAGYKIRADYRGIRAVHEPGIAWDCDAATFWRARDCLGADCYIDGIVWVAGDPMAASMRAWEIAQLRIVSINTPTILAVLLTVNIIISVEERVPAVTGLIRHDVRAVVHGHIRTTNPLIVEVLVLDRNPTEILRDPANSLMKVRNVALTELVEGVAELWEHWLAVNDA
jgi:hypothetical protein